MESTEPMTVAPVPGTPTTQWIQQRSKLALPEPRKCRKTGVHLLAADRSSQCQKDNQHETHHGPARNGYTQESPLNFGTVTIALQ